MSEFFRLVEANPLSVALAVIAALAVILYRVLTRAKFIGEDAPLRRREDASFKHRFERHAQRVHEMSIVFGEARRMLERFDGLERRVDVLSRDHAALVSDVTELKALATAQAARWDELLERIDRNHRAIQRLTDLAGSNN